jgi:hypothetical protein
MSVSLRANSEDLNRGIFQGRTLKHSHEVKVEGMSKGRLKCVITRFSSPHATFLEGLFHFPMQT